MDFTMIPWLTVRSILLLLAGCCAVATLIKSSSHQEAHSVHGIVAYHYNETVEWTQRLSGHPGKLHRKSRSSVRPAPHSRKLWQKDKFIEHLTGPHYFNPKCRTHFNRLYHIRDCVVPAYFKRCAHLLTRLAYSLRCAERSPL
ncbi:ALK and LTK ligand 2b [Corythoichthys intestinalis]|uniref:ALK and LTK ligand 2b n=1 Tax=Corythoichthys intestinalis TaxID=161448 RepID=UPI0025A5B269|nr:ALK and LTK ligand 2b [Corythoichthys intestinalis]